MGKAFLKNTADLLQKKHKRKQWQKIMISLSLVVALLTSCLLIHPAITMSRQATCGQEEHTHTEKCYEKKLICNKEEQSISESSETEGEESVEAHTHSDACYENVLICGKQEHTHSEACYPKEEEKKEEVAANTEEEDVKSEDQEDKAEEKTEDTEKAEARTLKVDQADYTVEVDCPAEANIPKDAKLKVREIKKDSDEYQDYYEKAMKAVASGDETDISFARFFDISFEVDGKEIEPEANVEVKITYDDKVEVPEKGKVKSVHFGNKTEVLDVKTNEKNGKMDEVKFNADSFSVYAIVGTEIQKEITLTTPDGENVTYVVSVTYGSDANIPEGSTLSVSKIDEGTAAYDYARNSVLADKKEKGEFVDIEGFNLAALDISIIDPEGNEVEPEATVQVSIRIKELPGVESLDGVKDTIEVQHHVETGNGVIVDKVFEGKTEGTYTMDTDENVIATGMIVDPSSVTEDDFITTENVMIKEEKEAEDSVTITFGTGSFSTYTITWQGAGGSSSYHNTVTMKFKKCAKVTVHFVDENGTPIKIYDKDEIEYSPEDDEVTTYILEDVFGKIGGGSYVGTYRDKENTQPITEIKAGRGDAVTGGDRSIAFFNNNEQIEKTIVANGTNAKGGDIYVVFSSIASHITVHFVDRNGNGLTEIKDPEGNRIDDGSLQMNATNSTIDLSQYTKEGYTYANTRINGYGDAGRIIYPNLRFSNNQIRYVTDQTNNLDSTNNTSYFKNGDEVYVILDPVPTGIGGGGDGTTTIEDLPDPETSKTLTDNNDGTYDLNLSITGKSDSKQANKNINVLFVIDNSSSMGSGTGSRLENTKAAVIASAKTLLKYNTTNHPSLVEVAAVSFDADANDVCSWTNNLDGFNTAISSIQTGYGTNWEDGLRKALDFGTGDGDPTYVIFFTDGMPYGYRGNGETYYASSNLPAMMAAKDEARAIVNSGRTLYGIFAYGSSSDYSADYLGSLIEYAYNSNSGRNSYYKQASASADVAKALAEIVDSITQAAGFTNVKLTDGITALTRTAIENGEVGGFTYYRSGGRDEEGNEKYNSTANEGRGEKWTTDKGAPAASYNASTGVTWDLGNLILEDGVTYTVSFTVWPDQEAYDTVAKINNNEKPNAAYNALDPTIKGQIQFDESTGICSLKTNTEAKASFTSIKTSTETKLPTGAESQDDGTWKYTDNTGKIWIYVKNEDGTYTGTTTQDKELTYADVPAIPLEKSSIKVKKIWVDDLTNAEDRPVAVEFTIYEDNEVYKTVQLTGKGSTWETEINIAPGIYVTPGTHNTASDGDTAGVMRGAEGHVYTIQETGYSYLDQNGNKITADGVENHYDFDTDPIKPMLNGTTTDNEKDMIEYLTKTGWDASGAELTATNTVKDGIYIYKKVTTDGTDEIDCDEQFTFKITLKDSDENPVYTTSKLSGDLAWRIDKKDASSSSGYVEDSRGYYTDGTVTLTMHANGRIRIVNVPVGTTFTVEEVTSEGTMPSGYKYHSSQVNQEAVTTNNKATGTTVGNKQWATTITNKRNALSVELLKVDNADTSKTLEGAEFSLFMADGTTPATDSDGNVIKTLRSGADGKVSIGTLLGGNYVLKETKAPDGYNLMSSNVKIAVAANNVTAMQGASQCTVVKSDDGLTYTVTVTNSAGVELPMTGGSGTLPYTLGGIALIMASALMYGFRMRRRERRLN